MVIPEKNRLFVAGCSYTSYAYPTYANILGLNFASTINLAKSGAGNKYIFNTLSYIFSELKPKKGDVVIAQWSGIARNDFVFNGTRTWETPGNLNWQDSYPHDWVDQWFNICQAGYEYVNYINAIAALAKQSEVFFININMFDPWAGMFYGEPFQTNIFHKHLKYINSTYPKDLMKRTCKDLNFPTSIEEYQWKLDIFDTPYLFYKDPNVTNPDLKIPGLQQDTHPTTKGHYAYAKYLNEYYNLNCTHLYSKEVEDVINKIHFDQTNKYFTYTDSRKDELYDKDADTIASIDSQAFYNYCHSKGPILDIHYNFFDHGYENDKIKRWVMSY